MRRFYKTVSVAPDARDFEIRLDDRPLRTPARRPLRLPTPALAEAVAAEWDRQGEKIVPAGMHLTQLVYTARDRVAPDRAAVIDAAVGYAETDLLCYRAEHPQNLVDRQHRVWQPLLDWCAIAHDAPLAVTKGVTPVAQPEESIASLRRAVEAQDDFRLIALQTATSLLGSLVLALALLDRRIGWEEAMAASMLDEDFQIERWGEDAEAAKRRAALSEELTAIDDFIARLDR